MASSSTSGNAGSLSEMSTTLAKISPIRMGIDLFNSQLTSDPKKRIESETASTSPQVPSCRLEDLLKTVVSLSDKRKTSQSVARSRIETALVAINSHAKAIDVLIQQQPDITAIVWGAFRFLLGVASKELDSSQKINDALVSIVINLERWNKYTSLFDDFEAVRTAAARLFSQIINYLVRAKIYYQTSRQYRHLKIAFGGWSEKYDSIMSLIHRESRTLECEAELAFKIRTVSPFEKYDNNQKVQRDHFALVKAEISEQDAFRTESNINIQSIQSRVEETAAETRRIHETMQWRSESTKALKWLSKGFAPSPTILAEPKTCLWIRESESWKRWVADSYSKPLCLLGSPGSGKSTAAQYLFATSSATVRASHFFRSVLSRDITKATPFAAAMLYRLLQQNFVKSAVGYTSTIEKLIALSGTSRNVNNVPFHLLWSIVRSLVAGLPEVMMIIDGLDECDEQTQAEVSSALNALSSQPNTQIIVSFRYNLKLEEGFGEAFKVELTPATVVDDIRLFVEAEIQRHPRMLMSLERELLEVIMKPATSMFIWVAMLLEELKKADTLEAQFDCLRTVPSDLYLFYDKILPASNLSPESKALRKELFLLFVGLREALTCQELCYILSMKHCPEENVYESRSLIDFNITLSRLCGSLVRISDARVHLAHETVKDYLSQHLDLSIQVTTDNAETYLAFKTLEALLQQEYLSLNKIAILVRHNVASTAENHEDKYFYQYAATHWYIHLIAIKNPEPRLLRLAATFLQGNAFVSWSEFIFDLSGSQGKILEVESKLRLWKEGLTNESKTLVPLGDYFEGPYRTVADSFYESGGDKTLPFITLFQLGEYFNLAVRIQEAFQVKQTVAEGLVNLLGERHPLALKAESAFALEYLGQRKFLEAEATFGRLAKIQREVIGTDRPDCFQSLQRQGMAQLWMTKFAKADLNLTYSLQGLLSTTGPNSFLYLMSQLTLGQVLEYRGEVRRAALDYEHIYNYRKARLGAENPMAVWAQCALVSVYRKLERFEEADLAVDEVINARTKTLGPRKSSTVDAIIQRLVLFLDSDRISEGLELADFILDGDLVEDWFERTCQVEHIRALFELFDGKLGVAIETLETLVQDSSKKGKEGRVRSMLWIRLDLATLLRREGRHSDAVMLFEDIVTGIQRDPTGGQVMSWEMTQSAHDLHIAEEALRMVRDTKVDEAELLLKQYGLQWVRKEDFWILNGSPPADTARMKRP
ncbi:hypothetical protein VTL71DRAFT_4873 [Oculimacula yallundae]|uniref:NACHT domain-containing protein n=1 Tax=Oculimacula yallundae TaxID=86028 RepID=A0ABR4C389_9HELO